MTTEEEGIASSRVNSGGEGVVSDVGDTGGGGGEGVVSSESMGFSSTSPISTVDLFFRVRFPTNWDMFLGMFRNVVPIFLNLCKMGRFSGDEVLLTGGGGFHVEYENKSGPWVGIGVSPSTSGGVFTSSSPSCEVAPSAAGEGLGETELKDGKDQEKKLEVLPFPSSFSSFSSSTFPRLLGSRR